MEGAILLVAWLIFLVIFTIWGFYNLFFRTTSLSTIFFVTVVAIVYLT